MKNKAVKITAGILILCMGTLLFISYICRYDLPSMKKEGLRISQIYPEDKELIAEKTELFFQLAETGTDPDDLQASVRQVYTFKNPTAHTIETRLFYTAGIPLLTEERISVMPEDSEQYHFYIGETEVKPRLRLFYGRIPMYPDIPNEEYLAQADGLTEGFFTAGMSVYEHVYRAADLTDNNGETFVCLIRDSLPYADHKYYCEGQTAEWNYETNRQDEIMIPVQNGDEFSLFVFGQDLQDEPLWEFRSGGEYVSGKAEPAGKKETDLLTFMNERCPAAAEAIPVCDRIALLNKLYASRMWLKDTSFGPDPRYSAFWYEYDLTIAPGESLVTSAESPVYPYVYERKGIPYYELKMYPARMSGRARPGILSVQTDLNLIARETIDPGFVRTADDLWTADMSALEYNALNIRFSRGKSFYDVVSKDLLQKIWQFTYALCWLITALLIALQARRIWDLVPDKKAKRKFGVFHFPLMILISFMSAWMVYEDGYRTFFIANALIGLYTVFVTWRDPKHGEYHLIWLLFLCVYTAGHNLMVIPGYPGSYHAFITYFMLYPEGCAKYVPSSVYGYIVTAVWYFLMVRSVKRLLWKYGTED